MSNRGRFVEIYADLAKAKGMLRALDTMSKAAPPGPKKGKPLSEQRIKGSSHTAPKEYREGGATKRSDYLDGENWKYPVDTYKHTRAAIGYFGKPENYGMYTESERKTMARHALRAAEKFGINVSDEWKQKFGLGSKKKEKR